MAARATPAVVGRDGLIVLLISRFWPMAVLAVLGGAVYLLLASAFSEALIAERKFSHSLAPYQGGPSALFALCGGVLGWASVALAARQSSTAGPMLWLTSTIGWVSAAVIGFGSALVLSGDPDGAIASAAIISLVMSGLVAAGAAWLSSE